MEANTLSESLSDIVVVSPCSESALANGRFGSIVSMGFCTHAFQSVRILPGAGLPLPRCELTYLDYAESVTPKIAA